MRLWTLERFVVEMCFCYVLKLLVAGVWKWAAPNCWSSCDTVMRQCCSVEESCIWCGSCTNRHPCISPASKQAAKLPKFPNQSLLRRLYKLWNGTNMKRNVDLWFLPYLAVVYRSFLLQRTSPCTLVPPRRSICKFVKGSKARISPCTWPEWRTVNILFTDWMLPFANLDNNYPHSGLSIFKVQVYQRVRVV